MFPPADLPIVALGRKIELQLALVNGLRARQELTSLTALLQRDPSPQNHAAHEAAIVAKASAMTRIALAVEAYPIEERTALWDFVRAKLDVPLPEPAPLTTRNSVSKE